MDSSAKVVEIRLMSANVWFVFDFFVSIVFQQLEVDSTNKTDSVGSSQ